jgi:hypothetical protein
MSSRVGRVCAWVVVGGLVCLVGFTGLWRLHGGHVERVETPSMGTVAPVGSLLWVAPVHAGSLRVGDFITFHPPGQPDRTYSHRVRRIHADGTVSTQGEISAPDPWRVPPSDVVGRVAMTWPGAGWVVRAAPYLLIGGLLLALVLSRTRPAWRGMVGLVGASLVLAAAITFLSPFTNADQLAFKPVHGGARATYVSTGLLPVELQADGGDSVRLSDGEVGSVLVPGDGDQHRYAVHLHPAVPPVFWVCLVGACFLPALTVSAARGLRRVAIPG